MRKTIAIILTLIAISILSSCGIIKEWVIGEGSDMADAAYQKEEVKVNEALNNTWKDASSEDVKEVDSTGDNKVTVDDFKPKEQKYATVSTGFQMGVKTATQEVKLVATGKHTPEQSKGNLQTLGLAMIGLIILGAGSAKLYGLKNKKG